MNLKTRLRNDWKQWHKWAGMRMTALAGILVALQHEWNSIPWTGSLPHWVPAVLGWSSLVSIVAGMGRRMTDNSGGPPH